MSIRGSFKNFCLLMMHMGVSKGYLQTIFEIFHIWIYEMKIVIDQMFSYELNFFQSRAAHISKKIF